MRLFERHGGYWLFWCSAIYLALGLYCALYYKDIPPAAVQLPWLFVIAGPFLIPSLGRWLNMSVDWDKKMFNWLTNKKESNVVPFPAQAEYGDGDSPPPQEPKKPAVTYYSLGMTSENRVELKMGYSAITMNHDGLCNLIDQLEVFKKQLAKYEGIVGDKND